LFALNASFGDTKPIVVYPNTFEEGYKLIQLVLDWSKIYQHPFIVLLDKQFSESYASFSKNIKPIKQDISEFYYNPEQQEKFRGIEDLKQNKFLRYKIYPDGLSSATYPGIKN
jgi:pyruvate/2-oxoacid:ferredoxin oxidoreductase alpha subunit